METIGRYRIEAEIGRGAMGVVYLATDPELERSVAIKTYTLPAGLDASQQDEFRRRFRREAQAAAGLSHPGIVTVFDAGEDPQTGLPFIAMEYVPGQSLADLLDGGGPLPLERVTGIAATLGAALAAAHAAGIVHRDIKPANVLVHGQEGSVKIADFGVAHVRASNLTRSGASIGTPAYMSPEQIRGRELDGRSDLFSLAAILYELLCGSRAFEGDEVAEVLYAVAHATPVPVCRRNPALPPALDRFFDRALAKEAEDRFADGETLAREFAHAAAAPAASTDVNATLRQVRTRPRRGRQVLWLSVAAVAALALAWIGLHEEDAHLMLEGKSRVDGDMVLLVDGSEVYGRTLRAPRKPADGEPGFLRKVSERLAGPDYESFQALIDVDAGKRLEIEVVVTSLDGEPYRNTLIAELKPGETRELKLVAGRSLGSSVSLRLD